MKRIQWITAGVILILAFAFLFTGCYTQLRTGTKISTVEPEEKLEEPYYEPEYGEEPEVVDESREAPIYQYNFYGWTPGWYGFYTPPFYGFGVYFSYIDPWYYDPFFWDLWYFYRWPLWYPTSFWSGYYGFYAGYYYGGFYSPYWGWGWYYGYPYDAYFVVTNRERRPFAFRRGINRETAGVDAPYMRTVAAGGASVSRVERLRKKPVSGEALSVRGERVRKGTAVERVRKVRTVSESRIHKVSRRYREPTSTVRTRKAVERRRYEAPASRRLKKAEATRSYRPSRKVRTKKTYTPGVSRKRRSATAGGQSIYKPRLRSGTSAAPVIRRSTGSSSNNSTATRARTGSSSRTRKKK
jgi:hypothetical protein